MQIIPDDTGIIIESNGIYLAAQRVHWLRPPLYAIYVMNPPPGAYPTLGIYDPDHETLYLPFADFTLRASTLSTAIRTLAYRIAIACPALRPALRSLLPSQPPAPAGPARALP